ncbi:MAG TPA: hypothetical protein VK808_09725 [Bacteroidia bacterium]|jgi:hypothetical protein|nr:hypothetical protein [Bacteroidia bacterium]
MKLFLYGVCFAAILVFASFASSHKKAIRTGTLNTLAGNIESIKSLSYLVAKDSSGIIVKGAVIANKTESLLFTSCASKYLKVTGATSHTVCGGKAVRNSINCGIEYYIYLSPVNKAITFDSLYIDNLSLNLEPSAEHIHAASNNYIIHVVYRYGSTRPSAPARHFTGAGLVLYKYKGRPHTVPIDTIVRLRPSKNS